MSVDAFIEIDGIEGESLDSDRAGQIDLLSWGWGMSQSGTTHMGGGGGAGKVDVQDLTFVKAVDKASSPLALACCKGTHIASATLAVRKAGDTPLDYYIFTMENILVTSVQGGGGMGEESLSESITLNFEKFEWNYQPQKDDGSADGGTVDMTWNISANTE